MNEYNHKKLLDKLARFANIGRNELEVLKDASNFTDSIFSFTNYYFFHFFYNINIKNNEIQLFREDSKNILTKYYQYNSEAIIKILNIYDAETGEFFNGNKKEFFSSINNRNKSLKEDLLDIGNQSDNVSFLHAMAAEDEDEDNAKTEYKRHLIKCFREYLFLKDETEAQFILGIALHGIMDSFTPSHTDFQKYTAQDMAYHAQGDVLPEDVPFFDPGQYNKENIIVKKFCKEVKGYDNNEEINEKVFKMLKIFLVIGDIINKSDNKRLTVNEKTELVDMGTVDCFLQTFKGKTLKEINDILKEKYMYGPKAYIYEDHALWAMNTIYKKMRDKRREIGKDYEIYKNKEIDTFIVNCIDEWNKIYDHMHKDKDFTAKDILLKTLFLKKNHVSQT